MERVIVRPNQLDLDPPGRRHYWVDHIDQDAWPARAGVDGIVVAQAWVAPLLRSTPSWWDVYARKESSPRNRSKRATQWIISVKFPSRGCVIRYQSENSISIASSCVPAWNMSRPLRRMR